MNKFKEFTALAPMGGGYKGLLARHSYKGASLEGAKEWANRRFVRPESVVIVEDEKYPDLYNLDQEGLKELYIVLLIKEQGI